jgi:hypothetical protein
MWHYLLTLNACGLLAAGATAAQATAQHGSDYNAKASAHAAADLAQDASALAPQVPQSAAVSPTGPTVIASAVVPDTPANRARYGKPLSAAGRRTWAIGD